MWRNDSSQIQILSRKQQNTYGVDMILNNGTWTYYLYNTNANVQALTQGQTVNDYIDVNGSFGQTNFTWRALTALVILCGALATAASSFAAESPTPAAVATPAPQARAKPEALRELVEVEQGPALRDLRGRLVRDLRRSVVNVPEAVWRKLEEGLSVDTLLDEQVRAYGKSLSEADAKALLAFFRSPVGQRYLSYQRDEATQREVMGATQQWLRQAAQRLVAGVQAAGYQVPEDFGAPGALAQRGGMPPQAFAAGPNLPSGQAGMPAMGGMNPANGMPLMPGVPGMPAMSGMPGMAGIPGMPSGYPQMPGMTGMGR